MWVNVPQDDGGWTPLMCWFTIFSVVFLVNVASMRLTLNVQRTLWPKGQNQIL